MSAHLLQKLNAHLISAFLADLILTVVHKLGCHTVILALALHVFKTQSAPVQQIPNVQEIFAFLAL
jgi:hypothetical protein